LLSLFLYFIPTAHSAINSIYCDSDNESDNESNNDNNSHNSKTSNSNSNSNSMNKSTDNSRISELESSKDINNNANKDVYTGSVTVDKSFTDMAVKEMGKVLVEGIGKVATEMGPYTTASAAASVWRKLLQVWLPVLE